MAGSGIAGQRPESASEGRVREVYARRDAKIKDDRYSILNRACLFALQSREHCLIRVLKDSGIVSLNDLRILDVGCGAGGTLRTFNRYGVPSRNLFGIDLLPDRVETCRRLCPTIDVLCGSAAALPFEDESFDLVSQFTLFDTILEKDVRRRIAGEMMRVVRKDGAIIWYDFRVNNPRNPDVRAIGRKEIRELFPGCTIRLRSVTLAPPIARLVAPRAWLLATALEAMPFLRTHYIGLIRKPGAA